MVLDSQISRPGSSRRHMVSRRRRRGKRWPLALAGAIGLALVVILVMWPPFGEESDASQNVGGGRNGNANASEGQSGQSGQSAQPSRSSSQGGASVQQGSSGQAAPSTDNRNNGGNEQSSSNQQNGSNGSGSSNGSGGAAVAIPPDGGQGDGNQSSRATQSTSSSNGTQQQTQQQTQAAQQSLEQVQQLAERTGGELRRGFDLIQQGQYIEGRRVLSTVLFAGNLAPSEADDVRAMLSHLNQTMVFSDQIFEGDPIATTYTVQSGDYLSTIAARYKVPGNFLARINGLPDPDTIRVGQGLKVIRGPFNAVIDKSEYKMHLYVNSPDGAPIYVCSYAVGLGEQNSTPEGEWIVHPTIKLVNPGWTNPRTNETYAPDDPDNPIGDYWIRLQGTDENTKGKQGYGIHGTIDPESIGTQASMGCIRLRDADIQEVFHMLRRGASRVTIRP